MLQYQFKKNGVAIDGATDPTMSLSDITEDDNGRYTLDVTESVTGKKRTFGPLIIDGVSGPTGVAPVNTVAPVVSGTAEVDGLLSCTTGTWTGDEPQTITYQWYRDWEAISGADESTRVPTYADAGCELYCAVLNTNSAGSAVMVSNAVDVDFIPTPANLIAEAFAGATTDSDWTTVPSGTGVTISDGSTDIDYGALGNTNKYFEITGLSLTSCRAYVKLASTVTSGIHTVMQLYAGATLVGQLIVVPASNHLRFDKFKTWSSSTGEEQGITTSFTFTTTFAIDLTDANEFEVLYRESDHTVFMYCNKQLIGSYAAGDSGLTITKLQVGKLSANTTGTLTISEVRLHNGTDRISDAQCAFKVAGLKGQSNAVGSDTVPPDDAVFPLAFLHINGTGTTESARFTTYSERTTVFATSNKMAFDATRVRELPSGYTPCILEIAQGGTGFTGVNNNWAIGNSLRLLCTEWLGGRLAKCLEKYSVDWIIWQQGENDAATSTGPEHEANLTELIESWRSDSGVSNLAVTCGGMTDYYITNFVNYQTILTAINNVCTSVPNCGFVDSQNPTPAAEKPADLIHFANAGLTTMGIRHEEARDLLA